GPSTPLGSDEARHQGAKDKLEIPLVRSPFCARRPWACSHVADANTAKKWWLVARDYGPMTRLLPCQRFKPMPSGSRFALDNSNPGTPLLVLGIEQRLNRPLPNAALTASHSKGPAFRLSPRRELSSCEAQPQSRGRL